MFVFGYNSSYQMILSFPCLVVILTTLGTPKNICINNNIMNDNSKQNKTTPARASLVVLYSQNYAAGIHGHYHESSDHFEYPKKSILKSSHPKKYLPNLRTQKIPESKISNPKKSFDHPRHLKSGVPPWDYLIPTNMDTDHQKGPRSCGAIG